MGDTSRTALLTLLVASYDDLKQRLTRRAGSADLADEALQDTFLRLSKATIAEPIRDLNAYLFRVAMSVLSNRRVAERRHYSRAEIDAFLDLVDDSPGPERIIEARSEIDALKRAILELPLRRREIVVAVFVNEMPLNKVAQRFGVSMRTIQVEIRQALAHCALRLDRVPRRNPAHRGPILPHESDRASRVPPFCGGVPVHRMSVRSLNDHTRCETIE
jgi:RNA polymerase sigma-70 factor (ECF subfamily)